MKDPSCRLEEKADVELEDDPKRSAAWKPWSTALLAWRSAFSIFCGLLFLPFATMTMRAADPAVEIVNQNNASPAENTAASWFQPAPRVEIYTSFRTGYDDNSGTSQNGSGSLFTNEQVTLSYGLPSRRTQLSLIAGIGSTNYFGQRNEINTFFDISFSRAMTRRLTLGASLNGAYTSEPDINENVGPNSFQGNYFNMNDKLWVSYLLTRRFSLVSSYSFHLVRYEDEATAFFTDRDEQTFGEQLRFTLTRTTVLTGSYQFLRVNYVSYPLDSSTNFGLVGIEHRFNSRLRAQVSGGVSFRSFDQGGDETDPDFEWSLNYAVSGRTTLNWIGSYSVAAPTANNVSTSTTFRTGLSMTHSFTGRISASLSLAYHQDENQQGLSVVNSGPSFAENTFDIGLTVAYRFNSRLSADFGFNHSEIMSGQASRNYSRNHYSVGFSYRF